MGDDFNDDQSMYPYAVYLSQLSKIHTRVQREILLVDLKDDPVNFCSSILSCATHSLLVLGMVKPANLMQNNDPLTNQDDFTLRDIVYLLKTLRALMQRISHQKGEDTKIIGQILLKNIS